MAIDIGPGAINRAGWADTHGYTNISIDNPANATGTITTFKIWTYANATGVMAGIFYVTGTNQLKCRAAAEIGSVTAGAERTYAVSLEVHAGDYLGVYMETGSAEVSETGSGMWYKSGNWCEEDLEATFSVHTGIVKQISIEGVGEESPETEIVCATQAATNITSSTLTLNGAATGLSESEYAVARGFEWDTDSGAPYANEWHEDGTWDEDITFDHDLSGLSPGVPIYFRAYIVTATA